MGDRGNIFVDTDDDGRGVHLYTHWRGSELPRILKTALKKRWRWSDPQYLARIIFCEMVKGDEMGETGYGISINEYDSNHATIRVLTDVQEVHIGSKKWTFSEFIDS